MKISLPLFPEQASSIASQVDSLFFFLIGISVFFSLLIAVLVIVFAVKYRRRGATHRVMTPLETMARLSALIPPPRFPLVRYAGVVAPNSPWRKSIVPRAPDRAVPGP